MILLNTSKKSWGLNSLLSLANIFICILVLFLYCFNGENDYINITTLLLLILISFENIVMLAYEKKIRTPLIIILVFVTTIFYMTRIATILHLPVSVSLVGTEIKLKQEDFNFTLLFIFFSNISMFFGFYFGNIYFKEKNSIIYTKNEYPDRHTPKTFSVIIIISLLLLFNFFGLIDFNALGRISGYFRGIFFEQHTIILFLCTYLIFYYDNFSIKTRTLFILILLTIFLLITLNGSRAAVLTIGISLIMGILAVKQRVLTSKKVIISIIMVAPISLIIFVISTFKQKSGKRTVMVTTEQVDIFINDGILKLKNAEKHLELIYYRLGYLDWSVELIADEQRFSKIVNGSYYAESIIDNVLTPGFDIFGTIMPSHALTYVRRGKRLPSKERVQQAYQSDQMGIYGEYYILFYGYPSLIVFFFLAFLFESVYIILIINTKNALRSCIYRAVLLHLFYLWLNSFGLDWFLLDIMTAISTTFLFGRFFTKSYNRKKIVSIIKLKEGFRGLQL